MGFIAKKFSYNRVPCEEYDFGFMILMAMTMRLLPLPAQEKYRPM